MRFWQNFNNFANFFSYQKKLKFTLRKKQVDKIDEERVLFRCC